MELHSYLRQYIFFSRIKFELFSGKMCISYIVDLKWHHKAISSEIYCLILKLPFKKNLHTCFPLCGAWPSNLWCGQSHRKTFWHLLYSASPAVHGQLHLCTCSCGAWKHLFFSGVLVTLLLFMHLVVVFPSLERYLGSSVFLVKYRDTERLKWLTYTARDPKFHCLDHEPFVLIRQE